MKQIVSARSPQWSDPGVSLLILCVYVYVHMQACVQELHVPSTVPLHWMHSCLTERVDTRTHFPAPMSVAEAEC